MATLREQISDSGYKPLPSLVGQRFPEPPPPYIDDDGPAAVAAAAAGQKAVAATNGHKAEKPEDESDSCHPGYSKDEVTEALTQLDQNRPSKRALSARFVTRVQALAITELILCCLIVILGIVTVYYSYAWWLSPIGYEGSPLWAGGFALINAVIGVLVTRQPGNQRLIVAHLVLSILAAILLFACFLISAFWSFAVSQDERLPHPELYPKEAPAIAVVRANIVLHAIVAACAFLAAALSIASCAFMCCVFAKCCCENYAIEMKEDLAKLSAIKRSERKTDSIKLKQRITNIGKRRSLKSASKSVTIV